MTHKKNKPDAETKTSTHEKKESSTKILTILVIASLVIVVFLAVKLQEKEGSPATTTTYAGQTAAAKEGDVVEIHYTGRYLNGTIFDTSRMEDARKLDLYNPNRDYQPIIFTIGLQEVVAGVEESVVGMKVGEKKTVTIPPEKGYGSWSPENIEEIPRVQNTSRVEEVPVDMFEASTGETAVVGKTIMLENMLWPIKIVNIINDTVYVEHSPENGTVVPTLFGDSTLTVIGDRIYARLDAEKGDELVTPYGNVKVLDATDDTLTIDMNHELAGQTIVFDIELVSINKVEDQFAIQLQTGEYIPP